MSRKLFAAKIKLLLLLITGLLLLSNFSSCAADKNKSKYYPRDAQTVGIINPDGIKSVWLVPAKTGNDILNALSQHPSMTMDGVRYYTIATWQDTVAFLEVLGRHHEDKLLELYETNEKLARYNRILRSDNISNPNNAALSERVRILEERMKEITDSGNP
jgi:hypothetical protein